MAQARPVSEQEALTEMNTLSSRLFHDHPQDYSGPGVSLVPLQEHVVGNTRPYALHAAWRCAGGSADRLWQRCQPAPEPRHGTEPRDRGAEAPLGASRLRLVRQMLTEGLLLSFHRRRARGDARLRRAPFAAFHRLRRPSEDGGHFS